MTANAVGTVVGGLTLAIYLGLIASISRNVEVGWLLVVGISSLALTILFLGLNVLTRMLHAAADGDDFDRFRRWVQAPAALIFIVCLTSWLLIISRLALFE